LTKQEEWRTALTTIKSLPTMSRTFLKDKWLAIDRCLRRRVCKRRNSIYLQYASIIVRWWLRLKSSMKRLIRSSTLWPRR
jgi:hypothetical protein